jgi:hypothetical protein
MNIGDPVPRARQHDSLVTSFAMASILGRLSHFQGQSAIFGLKNHRRMSIDTSEKALHPFLVDVRLEFARRRGWEGTNSPREQETQWVGSTGEKTRSFYSFDGRLCAVQGSE